MEISDLFNGVAVIIDDEIGKKDADINNLVQQIESKNIPCLKYTTLPKTDITNYLAGISFLLLDWILIDQEDQEETDNQEGTNNQEKQVFSLEGGKIPPTLEESIIKENIEFLKSLKEKCFVPTFIFTDEDTYGIKLKLMENDLYTEDKPNFIFVKNKDELTDGKFFDEIDSWIKTTPSIYVLKSWEKEYIKAKNRLFWDFYNMSPSWPKILWDNFSSDSVNMSAALGEVIVKNLCTRMTPFSFYADHLTGKSSDIGREELRKVIEGERVIKKDGLHEDSIAVGDMFSYTAGRRELYINIRPDCDCIPDRSRKSLTIDDVNLYLLKGTRLSDEQEEKRFNDKYGHFDEQDNQAIVFSMMDGKSYDFRFKEITIDKWSNLKDKRIGRLLPPHIIRIQQRYALYFQRQGLPRIPEMAIPKKENLTSTQESIDTSETLGFENNSEIDTSKSTWS